MDKKAGNFIVPGFFSSFNPDYVLKLRYEHWKYNKTRTYRNDA